MNNAEINVSIKFIYFIGISNAQSPCVDHYFVSSVVIENINVEHILRI